MACDICAIIEKKQFVIYQDETKIAFLSPNPAVPGHIIVAPKKHYVILEDIPDSLAGELFGLADELTSVLFQSLGSQGTNILLNNGVSANQSSPHVCINVLPRAENDNLNLDWEPKKVSDDDLATKLLMIKDKCKNVGIFDAKKSSSIDLDSKEVISSTPKQKEQKTKETIETKESKPSESEETKQKKPKKYKVIEDNYLIRQLRRLP